MLDQLVALIVDEGKWLTASMALAFLAVAILLVHQRHSALPTRRQVLAAMNLFFGITIGAMAFGHLLAVTTKLGTGTLEGPLLVFYTIGVALAAPSWWLIHHTRRILVDGDEHGRGTVVLNTWLAITLLALGPQNLPLAVPAALNVGYHLHTRRPVGWAIVGLAVLTNGGLFVGSLIFLMSGQSFEQFSGMQ